MRSNSKVLWIIALCAALAACGGDEEEGSGEGTTADSPPEEQHPPLPPAPPIAAGEDQSCAVKASGELYCWGRNLDGELGDGTGTNRRSPVPVRELTDVHAVAPGRYHACALKNDGTVWCWGRNDHGQLGDGTTEPHRTPVQVSGLTDATMITTGWDFSCALKRDSTVTCWGSGDDGRLGNGADDDSPSPVAVANLTDVTQIDAGSEHACALKNDGSVFCWGADDNEQAAIPGDRRAHTNPAQVPNLTGITQVSAGGDNTCVVHGDGRVSCWGDVYNGKVGNGESGIDPDDVGTPFTIESLTGVQEVSVGKSHVCARLESGAVNCWGDDGYGTLGGEERGDHATPQVVINLPDAQHVAAGGNHTCALRASGAISCWGKSNEGQLGEEDVDDAYHANDRIPSLADLAAEPPPIPTFEPDPNATAQIRPNFDLDNGFACGVRDDGKVLCWGSNHYGQLGDGTTVSQTEQAVEVHGISDAVEVSTSSSSACVRRANGQVACWGSLGRYNGSESSVYSSTPLPLEGVDDAIALANGGSGVCLINEGNTLSCVVRDGTLTQIPNVTGVAQVVGNSGTYCLRLESGQVLCRGSGSYGQLGNGTEGFSAEPVPVSGIDDATQIAFGSYHACALRRNGQVSCWGYNRYGQVGNGQHGEDVEQHTPASVRGLRGVQQIAAGTYNTLARLQDGSVMCWGANDHSQCGQGLEREERPEVIAQPRPVAPGTAPALEQMGPAVDIQCGQNTCCTLHGTGQLACWGSGSVLGASRMLGLVSSRSNVPRPLTQVSLSTGSSPISPADAAGTPGTEEPAAEEPAAEEPAAEEPAAEEPAAEEPAAEEPAAEEPPAAQQQQAPARPARRSHRAMVESAVRGAARGCYQRLGTAGSVTVRIGVGHDGRVTTARVVQNTTGNQELGRCISGAMVGRRFSAPRQGAVSFDIPFNG